MSAVLISPGTLFMRLTQLRVLLQIAADARDLGDPLSSSEQFQKLVALLLRVGLLFGFDPAVVDKWRAILTDKELVAAVLSVVRYVLRLRGAV